MLKSNLVEMPVKGIVKLKTVKGVYIYHILRSFRCSNGKPSNERIAIGKLDEETGKLIPNDTYFRIYETENTKEESEIMRVCTTGVTDFCNTAMKNSKLDLMLQKVFPIKYKKIAMLAQYMLSEGNVMQHIENWCEQNATEDNIIIKSQEVTRLFEGITMEERMQFFKIMAKARVENEFIAYDVTSISSYSKTMNSVEWGYNRDKESLPQINIAMYYGEESKLPLFYVKYPGSINDKAHMKYMLANNKFIDIKKVKFVMDKGFFSKSNIEVLKEKNIRYIIAIPNSLKLVRDIIKEHRTSIVGKSQCKLGANLPYAKSVEVHNYGCRLKMSIYYNAQKANDETEYFLQQLSEYEQKLIKKEEKEEKSGFDKYFNRNKARNTIERNISLIDEKISTFGFFVLLTTEHLLSEEKILEIYRKKDVVEKSFDNLKNELDMKRLRCHSEASTEGKLFISYIALIIKAYTYERLKNYMKKESLSYTNIIKEMQKIKQVEYKSKKIKTLPLTKKQREIMELL